MIAATTESLPVNHVREAFAGVIGLEPAARYLILADDAVAGILAGICLAGESGDVVSTSTVAAAIELLRTRRVRMILAHEVCLHGSITELFATCRRLEVRPPVVVFSQDMDEDRCVDWIRRGAQDAFCLAEGGELLPQYWRSRLEAIADRCEVEARQGQLRCEQERERALGAVQAAASRLKHQLSNPLSIISGNAQLMIELSHVLNLSEDLDGPLHDIEEASRRMSEMLEALASLTRTASAPGTRTNGQSASF